MSKLIDDIMLYAAKKSIWKEEFNENDIRKYASKLLLEFISNVTPEELSEHLAINVCKNNKEIVIRITYPWEIDEVK